MVSICPSVPFSSPETTRARWTSATTAAEGRAGNRKVEREERDSLSKNRKIKKNKEKIRKSFKRLFIASSERRRFTAEDPRFNRRVDPAPSVPDPFHLVHPG